MVIKPDDLAIDEIISRSGLVKRKKGSRTHKKERAIVNLVTAFDIETTRLHFPSTDEITHNDHSFMYVWQWAFDDDLVVVGRTWDEFLTLAQRIDRALREYSEKMKLDEPARLVGFIHNAAYEFQFLAGIYPFQAEECFFRQERKPIYFRMYDTLEFRCSYIQSNMSLAKFAEAMGCEVKKQSGQEFDYSKMRYPWTELSEKELLYCIDDVITLVQAIKIEMQRDNDDLRTIPLTSTGYVRRDCKKAIWPLREKLIKRMLPNEKQYRLMRLAFRGGNTHANKRLVGKIYNNVESYDMCSCYPAQQLTKPYPMTPFRFLSDPLTMDRVLYMVGLGYAVVGRYQFTEIELKDHKNPIPYIPLAKTLGIQKPISDNGRVLQADYLEMALTEIDLRIILDTYKFKTIACRECMIAKKAMLPASYRAVIQEYYNRKTELKGAESEEERYALMKSKNKLNGIFGMAATDPVHQRIEYNDGEYIRSNYDSIEVEKVLGKAPFPYQWGLYTTSYAREMLQAAIDLAITTQGPDSVIYCDTDSIKTIKPVDFTKFNARLQKRAEKYKAFADDRKGNRHYVGVFEKDAQYDRFITQGAKRYAFEKGGHMGITVSGVTHVKNPDTGAEYCVEELGKLERFRPGMLWVKAGGTMAVYNDEDDFVYNPDGAPGHDIHITKNVAIVESTYELEYDKDYKRLLEDLVLFGDWRKRHE